MGGDDVGQHYPLQKSVGFVEVSQSYICVKIALLFFLLITHGCGAPASWAARHTIVCLDIQSINKDDIHLECMFKV